MREKGNTTGPILGMAHVAIKAADLPTTVAFYQRVLGLVEVPRPPFGFPGAWLGTTEGDALIHLYAGQRARNADGSAASGTAAIDHVSLWACGYEAQRRRFEAFGLPCRCQRVPATDLAQLFVHDPNGVMIELTYRLAEEPDAQPGESGGVLQFDPQHYLQFGRR